MEVASPPLSTVPADPPARPRGWGPALPGAGLAGAAPDQHAALSCRPIGRLTRDEVVIFLYELRDRGSGLVQGYQTVVFSPGAATHA